MQPAAAPPGDVDGREVCIGALIVTFDPQPARLLEVVAAIAPQVRLVMVIDNGSAHDPRRYLVRTGAAPLYLLSLEDNYGVAAAQNIGISWAQQRGCTHVLLLDQDSVASSSMVAQLLDEMRGRERRGDRVAAVGPLIHDPRYGDPASFFLVTEQFIFRIDSPDPGERSARTDFLISAGVLLSMAAVADVGMMEEALFIDYVDLEWSMRATARGYRLYGHFGTRINHQIGDGPIRLLGRTMMHQSPLRHYYLVRNAFAVWRLPHPKRHWKILDALNLASKCFIFSVAAPRRGAHLRMILHGLVDGLLGRGGREDQARRGWRVPSEVRQRQPSQI